MARAMANRWRRYAVVMITCDKTGEARRIARRLVQARLAACASVYPKGESIYRWRGVVERAREHLVLAKARLDALPRLVEEVKRIHCYEVPEIAAFPLVGGSGEYLEWLTEELCAKKSRR